MAEETAASTPIEVSVVVPAYNEQECIEACLDEIKGGMAGRAGPLRPAMSPPANRSASSAQCAVALDLAGRIHTMAGSK